jgi:DNA-binding CsgD family transcriptional regulator
VQHDGGVVCLSDLVSTRRLLSTAYFDAMLRPSNARFVMSVALRDGDAITGVLSLVRDAAAGDFDTPDRALAQRFAPLLSAAYRGATAPAPAPDDRLAALTPREREIVRHVVTGQPNKEIARRLDVSPWTVKNHLRAIFEKTGVRKRTALCALAWSGPTEA